MTLLMKKIIRRIGAYRQSPLERRLHRRALLYWHSMSGGKEFVDLSAFDPMAIEDRSAHGFMLDLTSEAGPTLCYIGPVLRDEADVRTETIALADVPEQSLLGQFGNRYIDVLTQRQPLTAEYDFTTDNGYQVFCRGVLLPLSSNGTTIDRIYGVISWKSEKVRSGD